MTEGTSGGTAVEVGAEARADAAALAATVRAGTQDLPPEAEPSGFAPTLERLAGAEGEG